MGILMFTARVHDLIHQKHEVEYKLTKLTRRMRDLQKYSTMVSKGSITVADLLRSPGSMMGRTMGYLAFAHNSAMQYMQQNAPIYQQFYMQQMGGAQNPQQQQMMNNYIMRTLYTQGREQAAQIEEKNLNEIEEELKAEKEKLQVEQQEIADELKAAKEARDADIKDWAPKYHAQAG